MSSSSKVDEVLSVSILVSSIYGCLDFVLLTQRKLRKYGITMGVTMKNMLPLLKPTDCKISKVPDAKIPAKPYPEQKKLTI